MTNKYWKAVAKTDKKDVYRTGGIRGSKEMFFEIGKEYVVEGNPELCKNGFHFYRAKDYVFGIDLYGKDTVFLEVEPLSKVIEDTEKCVSTKIRIVRYIPKKERIPKKGNNTGNSNTGHWNSGHWNSGNRNSGNRNTGDRNTGYRNTGDRNSGYRNTGDRNSGDYNSGSYNSGNGYKNYVCEKTRYFLFDIEVDKSVIDEVNQIDMSWFCLSNNSYKEAWKRCPKAILAKWKKVANKISAIDAFHHITGITK